jgi:hypothetical protein
MKRSGRAAWLPVRFLRAWQLQRKCIACLSVFSLLGTPRASPRPSVRSSGARGLPRIRLSTRAPRSRAPDLGSTSAVPSVVDGSQPPDCRLPFAPEAIFVRRKRLLAVRFAAAETGSPTSGRGAATETKRADLRRARTTDSYPKLNRMFTRSGASIGRVPSFCRRTERLWTPKVAIVAFSPMTSCSHSPSRPVVAPRLRALAWAAVLFGSGPACASATAQRAPEVEPGADESPGPVKPPEASHTASASPTNTDGVPTRPAIRDRRGRPYPYPVATLPGFEMLPDGGSRPFVEVTKTVSVEERRAARVLTYVLKGARIVYHNNENALDTKYFNTPVARARLFPSGRDLLFLVDLRADSTPAWRMVGGSDGIATLQVDFPSGSFLPAGVNDDAPRLPAEPLESSPAGPRSGSTAGGSPPSSSPGSRQGGRGHHGSSGPATNPGGTEVPSPASN